MPDLQMSKKPAITAGQAPQPEKTDPEILAIEPEKLQENNNQTDLSPMETHADHLHKAPGREYGIMCSNF